ncbi:MAG: glycosyltransferase [Planctomycetota bacterium]|nr:glycosyltransferase [Planctomycetota bacterium]
MKTLFLSSVYPNPTSSVRGTFNRMLCHALNDKGQVRVVAPRPWPEVVRESAQRILTRFNRSAAEAGANSSVCIDDETLRIERPTFIYPPKVQRHNYGQFMWASVERAVERITEDFNPDWVLSYWAHPDGEAGLRAARMLGAKSGVIIGGSDVLLLTKDRKRCDQIKRVLQESDAVLAVCDGLNQRAVELGVRPDRVHTLYQGIDRDMFCQGDGTATRQRLNLSSNQPIFVWVGRMERVKRLDVLVESFQSVIAARPDAKLYLLGEGSAETSIRQLVALRGLSESVIIIGPVQQRELPDWYRAADATVLSSDSEGLPNVLRESLACGTPWVSTDVGSVQEIATVDHSIVVPVGDAAVLGEAMLQSLEPVYKKGAAAYRARTWKDTASDLRRFLSGTTGPNPDNVVNSLVGVQEVEA